MTFVWLIIDCSVKIYDKPNNEQDDLSAVNLCDWISEQQKAPDSI